MSIDPDILAKQRFKINPGFMLFPGLLVAGCLACVYLISISFVPDAGKFCELFNTNCLSIISSEYGSIFIFSSSSLGLAYYIFLLSFLCLHFVFQDKKRLPLEFITVSGTIGLMASLFYLHIYFKTPETCIACLFVHMVNFVFFICCLVFFTASPKGERPGKPGKRENRAGVYAAFSLLISVSVLFGINIAETRYMLENEKNKGSENLEFARYLHDNAQKHSFQIIENDKVIGDKRSLHQIVLIQKEGCSQCKKAKEQLIPLVKKNPDVLSIVIKNYSDIPQNKLEQMGITKAPMVFFNGQEAAGWSLPGFFDAYIEDCGC